MPVVGKPRNYDKKFLFKIEIEGLEVGWFETCGEISAEMGVVEQHEGGSIVVADQSPGKYKAAEVELGIGATSNDELYQWWLQVIDAAANAGEPDAEYKKSVVVVSLDRDGTEKKRTTLYEAWPKKYVAGEWDAKAEENVIEKVTLVYKRFDKKAA